MISLASISGLSLAWALLGVAAVALPVAAHLLTRRAGREVEFPGMRFVREIVAASARRRRLRDLALLSLRALMIALVALAFDRPVWSTPRPDVAIADGADVVVVLDRSASMTRLHAGAPLFDRASAAAIDVIRSLDPARDRAGVVFAGYAPEAALPVLTAEFDALVGALESAEATLERADLAGALALAAALPAPDQEAPRPRRIALVADLQRTQWAPLAEGSPPAVAADVVLVTIEAVEQSSNVAITGAAATPARPLVGRTALISATIANFGETGARSLVTLDSETGRQSVAVTVPAGGRTPVSFSVAFDSPGAHVVTLSLPSDGFDADNEVSIPVEVIASRPVAIISGAALGEPERAALYVHAALEAGASQAGFAPVALAPAAADAARLAEVDAVILVDAGDPGDGALDDLAHRVEAGAGAIWMIDSHSAQEAARRFTDRAARALPAPPGAPFTILQTPLSLASGDFESPALVLFAEGPARRDLLALRFAAVAPTTLAGPGAALLSFEGDAGPLIAWAPFGSGRLVTIHADLAPARSNLALSPLFPALLHELLHFAAPGARPARAAHIGAPLSIALAPGAAMNPPYFDDHARPVAVAFDDESGAVTLTAPPASFPGVVTIRDASGAPVGAVAVGLDPLESDLRAIDAADAARFLSRAHETTPVPAAPNHDAKALRRTETTELWPMLLAGALLLCAAESLLAARRPVRPLPAQGARP